MKKYTRGEIQRALRATVKQLREQPETYNFFKSDLPTASQPTGCILGLIGRHLGLRRTKTKDGLTRRRLDEIAQELFGLEEMEFYTELSRQTRGNWHEQAQFAARALEKFVAKKTRYRL